MGVNQEGPDRKHYHQQEAVVQTTLGDRISQIDDSVQVARTLKEGHQVSISRAKRLVGCHHFEVILLTGVS